MTSEERDLITGLFDRLRTADSTSKDQEADQLIGQLTGSQAGAPYRLVQTLLVQEHALNNATVRIKQLEQQVAQAQTTSSQTQSGGSFLSGLFGHHTSTPATQPPAQSLPIPPQQLPQQSQAYTQYAPPYPSTVTMAPSAGGGFLRGALQTAAGVAGGALVVEGIESLLGHHAGPFGGYGGGGFLGGSGGFFGGGGYSGGGDIIENNRTEVVNNYIDERGGGGGMSGGTTGNDPGFQDAQREDNRGDVERESSGAAFADTGFNSSNPFDGPATDLGGPAMDNTFDADNTDASNGGDSFSNDLLSDSSSDFTGDSGSSGSDDSSNV